MKTVFVKAPAYYHALIEKFKMHPFEENGTDEFFITESGAVYRGFPYYRADRVIGQIGENSPFGLVVNRQNQKYVPEYSTAKKIYQNMVGDVCWFDDIFDDSDKPYSWYVARLKQIYLDAQ